MTDRHMYEEYRVRQILQLVQDTLTTVMEDAASSFESDAATVRENNASDQGDDYPDEYDPQDDDDDSGFELEGSDLARAHWIQLQKTNKQGVIIQTTFINILEKFKQLRPIWQFGKKLNDANPDWKKKLMDDFYFRHHCASIQAAFTMIMENKDDVSSTSRVLNEMGAHHFFYDAAEPHFECFESAFMDALRKKCAGPNDMDYETEEAWKSIICEMKMKMCEGIAIARNTYMRQCITLNEIEIVRAQWEKVLEFGLNRAGHITLVSAIKEYDALQSKFQLDLSLPKISENKELFTKFCAMTMTALETTIKSWTIEDGFANLSGQMNDYVTNCILLEVCPTILRKAVMKGLIDMLAAAFGEDSVPEVTVQTWRKLYRVMEQVQFV